VLRLVKVELKYYPVCVVCQLASFTRKYRTERPVRWTAANHDSMTELFQKLLVARRFTTGDVEENITVIHVDLLDTTLDFAD
jgi:hypothetical protein